MISSQGSAMAIPPAPLRTARRGKRNVGIAVSLLSGQVEEGIRLRQRQHQLLDVVARLLEGRLERDLGAGVTLVQRLAVTELDPVVGEAALGRIRRGDL